MTDEHAADVVLTLWVQLQRVVPTRHHGTLGHLYHAIEAVEADRRQDHYMRGIDRGVQLERVATLTTDSTIGGDGEWQEGAKVN